MVLPSAGSGRNVGIRTVSARDLKRRAYATSNLRAGERTGNADIPVLAAA